MDIRDTPTGNFVRLVPVRHQFRAPTGERFEDNWLVIRGQVQSHDAAWTFEDPALLVDEARGIAKWLRAAAAGRLTPLTADDHGRTRPDTDTIEPNIGLGRVAFSPPLLTVRIFLCLESAPPSAQPALPWDYCVDLTMAPSALLHAADEWTKELANFPVR